MLNREENNIKLNLAVNCDVFSVEVIFGTLNLGCFWRKFVVKLEDRII